MRYLLKSAGIFVLLGCLPACAATRFQPTQVSPQDVAAQESEVKVRVNNGDRIETVHLYDFWATTDSIGGTVRVTHGGRGGIMQTYDPWAAPLSAVESLETRQPDRTLRVIDAIFCLLSCSIW